MITFDDAAWADFDTGLGIPAQLVITGPGSKIGLIDNQRAAMRAGWDNVKPSLLIGGRYKYADRVQRLCIIGI